MTITHPTSRAVGQAAPRAIRSRSGPGAPLLFFDPGTDGEARDPKSSFQAAQAATFFIGAQNSFSFVRQITIRWGIVPATALTGFAPIALFAIGGAPVTHELVAVTMQTFKSDGNLLSLILTPLYLSTTKLFCFASQNAHYVRHAET
jgi:hypothetical protein